MKNRSANETRPLVNSVTTTFTCRGCLLTLEAKKDVYNGALMQWYKCVFFPSLEQYLAASSLSPTSRLSPCSSSRETLRLSGLTGSGLSPSRVAGNSSANLSRNFLASSSSSPILGLALVGVELWVKRVGCQQHGRAKKWDAPNFTL